ncbi:hypothetical protein [Calothrix sp. CCY 0018]|uniref:hypothetical protein n=1 Tax=Calothrix sp. CCY 0018 TaxID=3103864 RepID=UPI0039C5B5D8
MKTPIEQAKQYILSHLVHADSCVKVFIVPCYKRDYEDFNRAMNSDDVQEILRERGITGRVEVVSNEPEIIIATVKDVAEGKLDSFLNNPRRFLK